MTFKPKLTKLFKYQLNIFYIFWFLVVFVYAYVFVCVCVYIYMLKIYIDVYIFSDIHTYILNFALNIINMV